MASSAAGPRTSVEAETTTYQWDAASQLTRRVVDGVNRNYQYDPSRRRTHEAWDGRSQVIQWFWDKRGNLTGQRLTQGLPTTGCIN
jgi:hypothetical protein